MAIHSPTDFDQSSDTKVFGRSRHHDIGPTALVQAFLQGGELSVERVRAHDRLSS
jgi:hypothetical protein